MIMTHTNPKSVTLRNRVVGQCVHSHGNTEVLQVVEKLAKNFELIEGDALLVFDSVQQPVKKHVVPANKIS